jgi:hypothetical protein
MNLLFYLLAAALLLPVVAVRLIFLISGRLGWINYLANVFSEFFVKKIRWSRTAVEIVLAVLGLAALFFAGGGWLVVLLTLALLLGLELYVSKVERWLLAASFTPLDTIGLRHATPETTRGLARGYPTPSTHPELTLNFVGPFVARTPRYELGALVVGRRFELRFIVGNHTIVPTQTSIRVRVEAPAALKCEQDFGELFPRLVSGEVHELKQTWTVQSAAPAGKIRFTVEWGHFRRELEIHFAGCTPLGDATISRAIITRYPGGCRAAFAWRGDMDLYDEATLQSIEGLEVTLGLAARYRMPQTMYLSSRLSLDEAAARQWGEHYGADRGAARIPEFIRWMQANVELRHECLYPFTAKKRFLLELGNHGHLHFGTDTAGAAENGWKPKARMGAGVYPWLGSDRSSFGEQRDNALETRRLFEKYFGYTPKSWAMPNRTNDRFTAAAMAAAGCEVLSDSNVRTQHNVLLQPPPHHPHDTSAVELTKRYPGDPQHIYHVAMNLFWIHRAHRRGIPVVFMCHQHLRQFDGYACARFTEYTLRYTLEKFRGDLHINTVFGIGKYWREVLSPKTRRVSVAVEKKSVRIRNGSDFNLVEAPLDVTLSDGRRFTVLASVPAGGEISVQPDGN